MRLSVSVGLAAIVVLLASAPVVSAASTVVVTNGSMHGWTLENTDANGNPSLGSGTAQFVTGPGTTPAPPGSVNLQTGNGVSGGDGSAQVVTSDFDGTALSSLTALTYYTYDTLNNGQQLPYLTLTISTGDSSHPIDILFFEPPYQTSGAGITGTCPDQGARQMNTWQSWDALSGCWWDANGLANPGAGTPTMQPLSFFENGGGAGYNNPTIQSYGTSNTLFPGVPLPGFAFAVGYAGPTDQFNGYVQLLTIGISGVQTQYQFEPTVSGAPQFPLGLGIAVALSMVGLALVSGRMRHPDLGNSLATRSRAKRI